MTTAQALDRTLDHLDRLSAAVRHGEPWALAAVETYRHGDMAALLDTLDDYVPDEPSPARAAEGEGA